MRLQLRVDLVWRFTSFDGCPKTQIEFGKLEPGLVVETREFRQRSLLGRLRREETVLELPDPGQRISQWNIACFADTFPIRKSRRAAGFT
jgi:hypothetical protein